MDELPNSELSTGLTEQVASETLDATPPQGTEETPPPDKATGAELTPDQLVAQVRQRFERGEIKPDDVSFLDSKFQSVFTKRLNNLRTGVEEVGKALNIVPPEGKTMYDLLSEDGGKGFINLMSSVVDNSVAPIRDKISKAENDQLVRSQLAVAQSAYPEVKKHFEKAVAIADSNPDLQEAGLSQGGRFLPYVLAGIAKDIELNEVRAKLAEMAKLVEKSGIATKVGPKTTQTGGKPQTGDEKAKGRSLTDIASMMLDKIEAGKIPLAS